MGWWTGLVFSDCLQGVVEDGKAHGSSVTRSMGAALQGLHVLYYVIYNLVFWGNARTFCGVKFG